MKFLTITIDYLPMPGGVARYTDQLCAQFGADMTVLADISKDTDKEQVALDRPWTVRRMRFMRDRWPTWMGAVHALREHPSDYVFTHHVLPLGIACLMHKRRTNTEYIVVLHGMDFELATRNPWKRWLTRQIVREAAHILVNSQALAQRVQTFTGREPLVVYPQPGIAVAPHVESTVFELLTVGRFVERKGMQRVLEALRLVPHLHPQLHYHMMGGEGPYLEEIRRLVDAYDLASCVTITANPTDAQIQQAYQTASVFVMPTLTRVEDREGFGIVYTEAAQFGVPSIATRMPGVDEAVVHNQTGLLISTDQELIDAITTLYHDADLRARLGTGAQDHVAVLRDSMHTIRARLGL